MNMLHPVETKSEDIWLKECMNSLLLDMLREKWNICADVEDKYAQIEKKRKLSRRQKEIRQFSEDLAYVVWSLVKKNNLTLYGGLK